MMTRMRAVLGSVLGTALSVALIAACNERHTETEIHDKPFGGTEVKEKTVTQQGDKAKIEEKKTEIDRHGNVTKEEKKTTEGK